MCLGLSGLGDQVADGPALRGRSAVGFSVFRGLGALHLGASKRKCSRVFGTQRTECLSPPHFEDEVLEGV